MPYINAHAYPALLMAAPVLCNPDNLKIHTIVMRRIGCWCAQRHVAEAITAALEPSPFQAEEVERVCRLLLAADRFAVAHLRSHCLRSLAIMFERLSSSAAPLHVRAVFEVRSRHAGLPQAYMVAVVVQACANSSCRSACKGTQPRRFQAGRIQCASQTCMLWESVTFADRRSTCAWHLPHG